MQENENYNLFYEGDSLTPVGATSDEPMYQKFFTLSDFKASLNYLLGQVLTQVDSSVTDPIQRKAMKDRIKGDFFASKDSLTKHWDYMNYEKEYFAKFQGTLAGDTGSLAQQG